MLRLKKYLEIRKKKHELDNDTVGVIMGLEGIGKSNLGLHIIHEWSQIMFGKCEEEDIRHMGLTKEMWANDLSDSKKDEACVFDEAGALSNRKVLSKFNTAIMEAYQVIRADRIFTNLILPDFFLLDPYFRNHRVKFLINVYKRGRFAFWLRPDIMKINMLTENRRIRSPWLVRPWFYDTFSPYKGPMAEKYVELKEKKTRESRALIKEIFEVETKLGVSKTVEKRIKAKTLIDLGFSANDLAENMGVSQRRAYQLIEELKD